MKRAHRTTSEPPAERHPERAREYGRDVQSVAYFNDAIFAIAMTLLVVSIRVPSGTSADTIGRALRGLGSSFASFGISFIVIGFYWLGYHRQLHFMERFDGAALVIDLLFLMSVAFLPFPTLLLNQYFGSVSVIFYVEYGRKRPPARDALDLPCSAPTPEKRRCTPEPLLHPSRSVPSADLPAIDPGRGGGSPGG